MSSLSLSLGQRLCVLSPWPGPALWGCGRDTASLPRCLQAGLSRRVQPRAGSCWRRAPVVTRPGQGAACAFTGPSSSA